MNWLSLVKLNDLYVKGRTMAVEQFIKDDTIKYLINTGELTIDGKSVIVNEDSRETFLKYYIKSHLQNFERYDKLLSKHGLKKPQSRYDEKELEILANLDTEMINGSITTIRQQIIDQEESIRGVSRMFFFKNEKYLDDKEDVIFALKKILNIDKLANDKEQQWIYKLTHPNRQLVVLCENLDFLRKPTKPLKHNIELWYAGGRNTPKLERERTLVDKPIFYVCDWDHDGLDIYLIVKELLPTIRLLTPIAAPIKLSESPNHGSEWDEEDIYVFGNVDEMSITKDQKQLIRQLINTKTWIREEDNDLIEMLIFNGAL